MMPRAAAAANAATRLTNMPSLAFNTEFPAADVGDVAGKRGRADDRNTGLTPGDRPLLVMPPPALLLPNTLTVVLLTKMPMPLVEVIFPLLSMPPKKLVTFMTPMPVFPAEIAPLLVMPPPALVLPNKATLWTKCLLQPP